MQVAVGCVHHQPGERLKEQQRQKKEVAGASANSPTRHRARRRLSLPQLSLLRMASGAPSSRTSLRDAGLADGLGLKSKNAPSAPLTAQNILLAGISIMDSASSSSKVWVSR